MKLEGSTEFSHAADEVWNALHDVDLLVKTIPGCKSMLADGDNSYVVAVSLGVASIKGDYEGKVKVNDVACPSHYMLYAEGAGNPGYVKMNVDCRLEPQDTGTLMRWTCDAEVGGLIASIGGRILTGISKYMAQQFFKSFKEEMARMPRAVTPAAAQR